MNKMRRMVVFGIGMTLAVLAVFTAPAVAQNIVYFDPDPGSAAPGETITVTLWLNATDGIASFNDNIHFDPAVVNITSGTPGDFPAMWLFVHYGTGVRVGGMSSDYLDLPPGRHKLATFTLVANNSGTSTLYHSDHKLSDYKGVLKSATWYNATFLCTETFSKSLPKGWNLVSLPLNPMPGKNHTSEVFGTVYYDAVYRYDATSHTFVDVTEGTIEPGVGYYVHVANASTWIYNGTPYNEMEVPLERGLNMIGWLNCSKSISDALSSIAGNYNYVARWNTSLQEFEVYVPGAPFNDFNTMEQGKGYFISAKDGCPPLTESCGA